MADAMACDVANTGEGILDAQGLLTDGGGARVFPSWTLLSLIESVSMYKTLPLSLLSSTLYMVHILSRLVCPCFTGDERHKSSHVERNASPPQTIFSSF